MAFPTIADADTKNGTQTSNSTSWSLTHPTNIAAGDLILSLIAADGSPTVSISGFTQIAHVSNSGSAVTIDVQALIATGSESGSFTATLGASEQGGWRVFRLPAADWYGSGLPATPSTTHSFPQDGDGLSIVVSTGTTQPNPFNLDPANWATEDTLWVVACAVDTSRTISVYPLADRNTADVSGGAGGATLGCCTTTSAVSSMDPTNFTISTNDDYCTTTIAIRPAAAVTPEQKNWIRWGGIPNMKNVVRPGSVFGRSW